MIPIFRPSLSWAKRLLFLLAGLLLGTVVMAGAALLYLDDEDYRRLLIYGADRFLDARLEINGPFSLRLGRELLLIAGDVRLIADDGSYSLEVREVDLRERLGSWLTTGTVWINRLVLADARLHLRQGEERDFRPEDLRLPPVVIEEVHLGNLHLVYEERNDGGRHEITLVELEIDDVNDSGPVEIRGEGIVNGRHVNIDGRLGAIAGLADTSRPYEVDLNLRSEAMELQLAGSIRDPVRGRGMDLQAALEDPAVSTTLRLFRGRAPEIGALTIRSHLTGDYAAPSLQDIEVQLQRGSDVGLRIAGKVDNVLTGEGLDLDIEGHSDDPRVLSWLIFEKEDEVDYFSLAGHLHEDGGRFFIRDADARTRHRQGLELQLTGDARLPTPEVPRPTGRQAMSLKFTAPGMAALNLPEFGRLPEFGAVTGSASYRPYWDGAGFADINMQAGSRDGVHVSVGGSIDFIAYRYNAGMSGVVLALDLAAVDTATLGRAIGYGLPELGAVRIASRMTGDTSNLLVENIRLETGPAEQPVIRASGTLKTKLRQQTSTLSATFDVAVADVVAAFRKVPTGYLGRLRGSFELSDIDGTWGLDRFDVSSTQTGLYTLVFSGALDDVVKRDKAEITLQAEIPDPDAFGLAADINLAGVSPYRVDGVVRFRGKQVHYLGKASIGRSHSQAELTGFMQNGRPSLKGRLVMPVLYLEDFGISPENGAPGQVRTAERPRVTGDKPARAHVFSRDPLRLDVLGLLDLDMDMAIEDIDSGGISAAQKLEGRLVLRDRMLHIGPLRLVAEGGPTDLDLKIDARDVPAIELRLGADDQRLGPWLAQVQGTVPVEGYANYDIELSARGRSPHALASSLDGKVSLAFENAKIPMRYIEYLSVDVFGWVAGQIDREERYTNLDCVLGDFDIRNGQVTSTVLAADGPRLAIEGTLSLDLEAETIEAVFLPKQKRKVFASMSPVRLGGDMRSPDVTAIPAKDAAKNIGALVLVPYVAIPVAIFGKLWDAVDDSDAHGGGCANLQQVKAGEAVKAPEKKSPDYQWYLD